MTLPTPLLRWAVRLVILGAVAAAAFYAWRTWQASQVKTLDDRYLLEEIARGDVTQTVTASGTLTPVVLVNVGTQVSGTVTRLYADFNSKVTAGQVLLELDPTLFRAAVEQSRGNVANAEAALRLALANEKRMRELFAKEYVSQQDLDQATQAREAAEAQLRTARGQLVRDQANVDYSVIRSPVSGIVVSRQVDVGQTVAASFQTPTLFQIAQDLSKMQINSNVAEADIGKIRVGMPVRFTVDAFPERRFEGTVHQIRLDPIIQQNVVTYNVVVAVNNPDHILLPGMTAYIGIDVDRREDALLVPTSALRFRPRDLAPEGGKPDTTSTRGSTTRPSGPRVYVARGEELVPVPIQVGLSDGRLAEVTGGELAAGDRVAVQQKVADGGGSSRSGPTRVRGF
jgi:HlyD family secretion protein